MTLEPNRIYQGDCLELMRQLPDKCVDAVITDPPYGINYHTGHRKQKWHDFCMPIQNDANTDLLPEWINEIERVMVDDSALYMFCSHDSIETFKPEISKSFVYKNTITWVKNNWTAGDLEAQYGKQTELIVYANKGRRFINGSRDSDVWYESRVSGDSQLHQNQKPIGLIERAILKSTNPNDLILDPFLGSGTTAVACLRTGRRFIGIEISPEYCAIAQKRVDYELSQLKLAL